MAVARILIGEDDQLVGKVTSSVLRRAGHEVDIAPDVVRLRQLFASGHYDVIMLDVVFGDVNGADVARELRDAGATAPIVGWSADGPADEAEARRAGFDTFLWKPVENRILVETIQGLVTSTK